MDFVLSLAALQAIILSVAIFSNRSLSRSKYYLGLILLLSAVALFGRVSYQPSFIVEYQYFFALPDALLFMFGPLSYFFIGSILDRSTAKNQWLHFIPAIFNALVVNSLVGIGLATNSIPWIPQNLGVLFSFIELGGIVSCTVYILLGIVIFKKQQKKFLETRSNVLPLSFVKGYLFVFAVLVFLWLIGFLLYQFGVRFSVISPYDVFWLATCLSIYLFTYYYLNFQKTFQEVAPIDSNSILDPKQLDVMKVKLQQIIKNEQPYLMASINIDVLADQSGMKRHHLSEVINRGFGMTFFDFINAHRIGFYIDHYRNNQNLTFIQAAFDSGFNSKTAFNRAFKKETGQTPSDYFRSNP